MNLLPLSVDVGFFDRFLDTDIAVFEWVQDLQQSAFEPVMTAVLKTITNLGIGGILFIILAVLLTFTRKYKKSGIAILLSLLVMIILNDVVFKNFFSRPRPYNLYDDQKLGVIREQYQWWAERYTYPSIVSRPSGFSFPSGHASSAFCAAVATALASGKARLTVPFFIVAILMAFSRVYVEVHYFSDVIAGALFGVVYGLLGTFIVNFIWKRFGGKIDAGIEKLKGAVCRRQINNEKTERLSLHESND